MLYSILLLAVGLNPTQNVGREENVLEEVIVSAEKGVIVNRQDTLSTDGVLSITDLLLKSPSLQISDYGGAAGLKNVSLRGFGSAHTTIYIDGIRMTNVQSGQTDLGILPLTTFNSAIINYAQNSLNFKTARPVFEDKDYTGYVKAYGGSFNTYSPSIYGAYRLGKALSISANLNAQFSKGDYVYTANKRRSNNDFNQINGGFDLFGDYSRCTFHVKSLLNASKRGTPGSIYYPSTDRQNDVNYFIQGDISYTFSPFYTLRFSAKDAVDKLDYISEWGNSNYDQNNLQLNLVHDVDINDEWKVTVATDAHLSSLESNLYHAERTELFTSVAGAYHNDRASANLALDYSGVIDKGGARLGAFMPSVDVRVNIAKGLDLVAFARRDWRAPTFNELYYPGFGNDSLKPEDAFLMDCGLEYRNAFSGKTTISAKVNGFYNLLTNKIVSAPTPSNPAIWLPYNIGKVRSLGLDAALELSHRFDSVLWSMDAKYTLLDATDRTPDSSTFGKQIPFVAKHTAYIGSTVTFDGWLINANWQGRFGRTESGSENAADWNTVDITVGKTIDVFLLKLSLRNIFDYRYSLASGYPMPGRSAIVSVEYKF